MPSTNKDYFSKQSAEYAKYRPLYPPSLFAYLSHLTPDRRCALDCATGNGQAAIGLAHHFEQVIALDLSAAQIADAFLHSNIEYRVGPAEQLDIPAQSVNLIAVAQALHWFDLDRFYAEVHRVLNPGGAIAVWTYSILTINPDVDAIITRYHDDILAPYWPPERLHVVDGYRSLSFPFQELPSPDIVMEVQWTLEELLGYLRSWSATQRYVDRNGESPLDIILHELQTVWGRPGQVRRVCWPLKFRLGRLR